MTEIVQFVPAPEAPGITLGDLRETVAPDISDEALEEVVVSLRTMQSRINYPSRRNGPTMRRVGAGAVEPLFPPCHSIR